LAVALGVRADVAVHAHRAAGHVDPNVRAARASSLRSLPLKPVAGHNDVAGRGVGNPAIALDTDAILIGADDHVVQDLHVVGPGHDYGGALRSVASPERGIVNDNNTHDEQIRW
jgi:hypothetical protein